ncbi:acyl-CoA thioesterase [Mangrovimonas sp. CR14]|uniref:acyl-CoA thioesterase n=1 Tax=Mangrovimonas sp. CR14 TaxID=2706120 RepID=UPI0014235568|nr:thioesterase family protein [Mangrovimonas sp. CR14]NIK92145.1 acyl-CoA thioesterase [Mangrovimonas sp. CR14]
MNSLEKIITVSEEDLDELQHVNNIRYVQWVQDMAKEHWQKETTKNINDHFFWVMLSHHIEYKKEAKLHDKIIMRTYVRKTEGIYSFRIVEFYNEETQILLAKSETKWCFMNADTLKPNRIPKEIIELFD